MSENFWAVASAPPGEDIGVPLVEKLRSSPSMFLQAVVFLPPVRVSTANPSPWN